MTDMKDDDIELDASNPQGLLEYIQRLKAENARLESRSRLGLNFENTPDENVAKYSTRVPLSAHEPDNDVMTDANGITHDLIIGDNYPGLLTLLPKYEGRINVIYIDPPYNTGNNDFIYNDRYTNPEDSYKHSKWLSFMEPRLMLAKRLLSDDGAIFVSIDDHEHARLRLLMDGIFGEKNFVGDGIRKTKSTTNDIGTGFNIQHEYYLIYAKNIVDLHFQGKIKETSTYKNPDNDPLGAWVSSDPSAKSGTKATGWFPVTNPYTGQVDYPPKGRYWCFSNNTIQKHIDQGTIVFKKTIKQGQRGFIYKRHLKDIKSQYAIMNSIDTVDNEYMNQHATKELLPLIGDSFSYPKGVNFIKRLLSFCKHDAIILDFFAGSGTTGQAVAELNAEDGGNRHCILITDEGRNVDDPSAVNIARDITYTRLQRVLTGRDWADGREHPSLYQNLRTHHLTSIDTLRQDGINKRAMDDIIMDIIDDLYHDDHGENTPVDYTAYLDGDYQSRARSILNSWRNAVQD